MLLHPRKVILFDFTATYLMLHNWLYNAVGFAVRCVCDPIALTCIKIITLAVLFFDQLCYALSLLFFRDLLL